jgi:hypothetical protein
MIRVLRKIFELAYGDYLTLEYVRSAHSRSLGDSISGSNTYNTNDVFAEIWQDSNSSDGEQGTETNSQFQMAWISVRDPTNITTAPVSSSKFDFNIRLTIALQLLERFRLWVISHAPRAQPLGPLKADQLTSAG